MDFGRMEAMLERRGSDSGSRRHPDFGGFGGMGGLGGFGRHHGMWCDLEDYVNFILMYIDDY
jgi:hypothetical protein